MSEDSPQMNEADLNEVGAKNAPHIPAAKMPNRTQRRKRPNGLMLIPPNVLMIRGDGWRAACTSRRRDRRRRRIR